ncbi:hypothetical protein [Nannocystis bainbridge]|uniref:HEAT repeat domain-containing protein n=1 Tax=Nannocystis bainbridge TaxID=2995303 RepID=A0ABT5DT36_9BACT|nr:hypothetical protein [Nannocystis bainbridge]MDC0715893.1 hypothetical protein [Nannocystis bainbridge]
MTPPLMNDLAATWSRWKEDTFGTGYHIWHEGLDVAAVTRLKGQARTRALAMLQLGRSLGDDHASEALAAMRDPPTLEAMRVRLDGGDPPLDPSTRVRFVRALHDVAPDPRLADHLVAILQSTWSKGQPWSARVDAAMALRVFAGPADEAALLHAVADPSYLVRSHACDSLLHRWGVRRRRISDHPALFALIRGPDDDTVPTADDLARFAEARRRLQALRPDQ